MESFQRNIEDVLKDLKSLDSSLRRRAIQDLAVSDYSEKISLLNDLLRVERDIQLKYEIRKAINEIDSLSEPVSPAIHPSEDKRLNNLKRAFLSTDPEIMNRAFQFALENKLDEFLPEMMMIENYSLDSFHRCCIVKLMMVCSHLHFRSIMGFLQDPDPRVLSTTLEALEEIGNTSALAAITQFVEHPHNRVQATAIKALHNLGGEGAGSLFLKMLQSSYSAYRDSAAYALCRIDVPEGVKLLSILLVDEVESVRKKALDGLQIMAGEGNVEAGRIVERIRNENPYGLWPDKLVERMILSEKEIEETRDGKSHSSIDLAALYSNATEFRLAAIQKLSEDKSDEDSARALVERLKLEKDPKIIASAVLGLGRARGEMVLKRKILESYLKHADDRIRANAVEALTLITDPRDRGFLFKCLDDPYNRVVGNTVVALWETLNKRSTKALERLAISTNQQSQLTAVYYIGEISDWKLSELGEKLLKSRFDLVVTKMEETLEHLQDMPSFAKVLKRYRLRSGNFENKEPG